MRQKKLHMNVQSIDAIVYLHMNVQSVDATFYLHINVQSIDAMDSTLWVTHSADERVEGEKAVTLTIR